MTRTYEIRWYEIKNFGEPLERITKVQLSKPTGDTKIDAKAALNLFVSSCGSLKYITIIYIKEFDENGNQIGEDIVPVEGEDSIIPIAK